MSDDEKLEEGEKLGLPKGNPSALGKITTAGYTSLDLIRYFTCELPVLSMMEPLERKKEWCSVC